MIILGFRRFVRTLAVLTVNCERCGNPSAHRLVRRSRRLVVLFVPLLSVARSWKMTCTYCAHSTSLPQYRVEQLLAGAAPRPVPQIADARRR